MTGEDGNGVVGRWRRACNARPGPGHPFHGSGVACHFPEGHEGGHAWDFGGGQFYDFDGESITWNEWAELLGTPERIVAYDALDHDVEVSTVWLGLDHGFGHTARPLIYETVIFGGPLEGRGARYATREEALAGHRRAVEQAAGVNSGEVDE
jgi:hypothetical protein